MKIRTKLIISYLLLITMAFALFYVISTPLVRNYIKKNVSDGLVQESILIQSRTNEALQESSDRESYIKTLLAERVAIERLGLSSKMGLMYFNRNTGTFLDGVNTLVVSDETKTMLWDKITSIDTEPFETSFGGKDYLVTYFLPHGGKAPNQRLLILVYTPLDTIRTFTRGFTRTTVIAFLCVLLVSLILALIFSEKINNPVSRLKKQALALKNRDFSVRSEINTGDEFSELSKSMNSAAEELEGYSRAQQEFLDNISHELRTPLMSIQGYAEGIRDGIFPADEQTLDIITDESVRLKKLVGEISYLSKLESMPDFYKKTVVDTAMIIERSVDAVSGLEHARGIKIAVLNQTPANIKGDGEKLIQLMINILSNAIRYADKAVFIDTHLKESRYIITVKDDGPGIPAGEEKNIFRRFYKGYGGNTGLGLSIAMAVAQNHGGTITAWNASPAGAVFEIVLDTGEKPS